MTEKFRFWGTEPVSFAEMTAIEVNPADAITIYVNQSECQRCHLRGF